MASTLFALALAAIVAFSLPPPSNADEASYSTITYHGGPVLSSPKGINLYLVWYGSFSHNEKATIIDFLSSFAPQGSPSQEPSVSTWWKATSSYKGKNGRPVASTVRVARRVGDMYSLGKKLTRSQIADIVKGRISAKKLPVDRNGIYLVLTSKDVAVERFCMSSCGFHESFVAAGGVQLVYGHVGDPAAQCPGMCSWPFAVPAYGPPGGPLVAPNGVGVDGVVMNIATVLAGAATNPFKNGYFQGDRLAPLEAVTACPGVFGEGAYPGFPGKLMMSSDQASFNVYGGNGRRFLLPAMWDLGTATCKVLS